MLYFYILLSVQIVLESFPVSSSSHVALLELYAQRYGLCIPHCPDLLLSLFSIDLLELFMHGPTALLIMLFFFNQWFFLLKNSMHCWRIILKICALTVLADSVTVFFFFLFKFIGKSWFPLGVGFMITVVLLFSLRYCAHEKQEAWNWRRAFIIGMVQGIALLPGISRLASTYVVARWLSLSWKRAFEISFLIQWPLIMGGFLHSLHVLIQHHMLFNFITVPCMCVMFGASIAAFGALWLMWYAAKTKKIWLFSFYVCVVFVMWIVLKFY